MTKDEAVAEAKKRWGDRAVAHHAFKHDRYEVGIDNGGLPVVKGVGASWEAAFADADARSSR